jgi:hypothetical protein
MSIAAPPGLLPWLAVLNGLLWLALLGIALALALPRKRRGARRAVARRAWPARAQSFRDARPSSLAQSFQNARPSSLAQSFQDARPSSLSPSGVSVARS